MSELTRLLEQAAQNLSGHPCKVRWRRPARTDALANCFKHNGQAVIDLHPGFTWDDRLLDTLCHEAAHVRQLWHEWRGIADLPSGSVSPPRGADNLPGVKQMEASADTQARRWVAYAQANYNQYWQPGDSVFVAMLRTLTEMKP